MNTPTPRKYCSVEFCDAERPGDRLYCDSHRMYEKRVEPTKPPPPVVCVKTDNEGRVEAVIMNGALIPNAHVDVDTHAGRVTLSFPAKVVIA